MIQQLGTPYEIYNDPVNHFVADFMGSPGMNFIECVVKDQNLVVESGGEKYELSRHKTRNDDRNSAFSRR